MNLISSNYEIVLIYLQGTHHCIPRRVCEGIAFIDDQRPFSYLLLLHVYFHILLLENSQQQFQAADRVQQPVSRHADA